MAAAAVVEVTEVDSAEAAEVVKAGIN